VLQSSDENMQTAGDMFDNMMTEATEFVKAAGYPLDRVTYLRYADMRYLGQEHTIRVPIGDLEREQIESRFHDGHERAFTYRLPDNPIQFVNFQVSVKVAASLPDPGAYEPARDVGDALVGTRDVLFEEGMLETKIYRRLAMAVDESVEGPAIIEEPSSTTVVHPGQRATIDRFGNLIIDTGV
jgi:N-methylhydantoinase A